MVLSPVADLLIGLAVLLLPIGLLIAALVLIIRLATRGELQRGLWYILLLPSRRKTLIQMLVATVVLFFLAGLVNGLTLLGVLSETASDVGGALADVGASFTLFLLLLRGLGTTALTEEEKNALTKESTSLAAMGVLQSLRDGEPFR